MTPARVASRATGALVAALLVAGCGGDGSGELPEAEPSRSLTVSASVTATLPRPTRSPDESGPAPTPSSAEPTPTPSSAEPTPPTPSSAEPTPTQSSAQPVPSGSPSRPEPPDRTRTAPEPTASREPTQTRPPSPAPTTAQEPAPAAAAPAQEDAPSTEDDPAPTWWWLLAALAVAAVAGVLVYRRTRRRRAWDARLVEAEAEVTWLSQELLPALARSGSLEAAGGAWSVSRDRVSALERSLDELGTTSYDDVGRLRAQFLLDAVRRADRRVDSLVRGGHESELVTTLVDVVADLETAAGATAPAP